MFWKRAEADPFEDWGKVHTTAYGTQYVNTLEVIFSKEEARAMLDEAYSRFEKEMDERILKWIDYHHKRGVEIYRRHVIVYAEDMGYTDEQIEDSLGRLGIYSE